MRVLGIDPGLERTGWGIIDHEGSRLSFVAAGIIRSKPTETMAVRLCRIDCELTKVIEQFKPETAAIEETFVNKNSGSSLKLGQARGVGHGQRTHLLALQEARARGPVDHHGGHLPARQVRQRRRGSGVGNVDHVQAGVDLQQLHRQVVRAAHAG